MGFLEEDGLGSGSTAYAQAYVYSSGNNSTTNSGRVFNTTSATTGYPSTDPGSLGDVIMICHDRANKKIWLAKTVPGSQPVVGDPATGTAPAITYTTDKVLLLALLPLVLQIQQSETLILDSGHLITPHLQDLRR